MCPGLVSLSIWAAGVRFSSLFSTWTRRFCWQTLILEKRTHYLLNLFVERIKILGSGGHFERLFIVTWWVQTGGETVVKFYICIALLISHNLNVWNIHNKLLLQFQLYAAWSLICTEGAQCRASFCLFSLASLYAADRRDNYINENPSAGWQNRSQGKDMIQPKCLLEFLIFRFCM